MSKREEWINSKINLLIEESKMSEDIARKYLDKICEAIEKEGDSYDDAIFKTWQKLAKLLHDTMLLVQGGVEKNADKLKELYNNIH